MGFAGFADIYRNRNKLLSEISEARRKNILANKPANADWQRVFDWWNYFENKFYSIYNEHKYFSVAPTFASVVPSNPFIIAGIAVISLAIYLMIKN